MWNDTLSGMLPSTLRNVGGTWDRAATNFKNVKEFVTGGLSDVPTFVAQPTAICDDLNMVYGEERCNQFMTMWCPTRPFPTTFNICRCINPKADLSATVLAEMGLEQNQVMCFDNTCWNKGGYLGFLAADPCVIDLCVQSVTVAGEGVSYKGSQQLNCNGAHTADELKQIKDNLEHNDNPKPGNTPSPSLCPAWASGISGQY